MHFLGNLGIDLWLLLAQVVNFLILLAVLTKFVYRPLIKRIEADETALAETAKAQKTLEEKEMILEEQHKRNLAQTKEQAKRILTEAEEIAANIREQAQQEMAREKEEVLAQLKKRFIEIEGHGSN